MTDVHLFLREDRTVPGIESISSFHFLNHVGELHVVGYVQSPNAALLALPVKRHIDGNWAS